MLTKYNKDGVGSEGEIRKADSEGLIREDITKTVLPSYLAANKATQNSSDGKVAVSAEQSGGDGTNSTVVIPDDITSFYLKIDAEDEEEEESTGDGGKKSKYA